MRTIAGAICLLIDAAPGILTLLFHLQTSRRGQFLFSFTIYYICILKHHGHDMKKRMAEVAGCRQTAHSRERSMRAVLQPPQKQCPHGTSTCVTAAPMHTTHSFFSALSLAGSAGAGAGGGGWLGPAAARLRVLYPT